MNESISFNNGIQLELLNRDAEFLGIGQVAANGTVLRSAARPMFVDIRTPQAVQLSNYRETARAEKEGGLDIEFAMQAQAGGLLEWMVHEVRPRVSTADWTSRPQDATATSLRLELRPLRRVIGKHEYIGYSYQYHYSSENFPIYKLVDRGTWELGGSALGNEFWMRNCFTPALAKYESAAQFHSTEWYLPDAINSNIFQFLPLQTELQGFTFTTSAAGVLATFPNEVRHIRSLFEKPRGAEVNVHWHEHCGDLESQFSTSPVEVLFLAGNYSRVQLFNIYEELREMAFATLHEKIGMQRERLTTYGQIEEWTLPDIDRYRKLGLPKLLAAGCRKIYIATHFENNMNTWSVGNMCCTVDHKIAASVGAEKVKALCDDARAGGARVEMWGNTALSALTWIFGWEKQQGEGRINFLPQEDSVLSLLKDVKPDIFVHNPSNAVEADHYTPIFMQMNLRVPEVAEYWVARWKAAHDDIGLQGIFLDSSFNMTSDKFNWVYNTQAHMGGATADQTQLLGNYRPEHEPPSAIQSQYLAHLQVFARMQKDGIEYCTEDLGVFGIHRHGPGVEKRLDSLPIWLECITHFDIPALQAAGADLDGTFVRGLAYRMVWSLCWDINNDVLSFHYGNHRGSYDIPAEKHLAWYRAYSEVESNMQSREILEGPAGQELGVIYRGPTADVVWAFEDFSHVDIDASSFTDQISGEKAADGVFKKNCVYLANR